MKILLIRFSSIGDIVLTSPVIRCLKQQLEVEIHFITKRAFAPILAANPYVDKVYSIHKEEQPLHHLIPTLKKEKYDYLIDLHQNLRSWYLRLRLWRKTYGFRKLNFKKWLYTQFKINQLPPIHIVDRYLETVSSLEVTNDDQGLDYFIPKEDYVISHECYQTLRPHQFIAFVIGAAHFTKRLPTDKIIRIIQQIKLPVALIGGKDDHATGQKIAQSCANAINLCGQLSLHASAAIVDQAHTVITHDTGFMHIAAARKKRIISVWGNTVPAFGMSPYLPSQGPSPVIIENNQLACRPCHKIGRKSCPKQHFNCMNALDIHAIVKAIAS